MTALQSRLKAIRERAEKATAGPGEILHTEPVSAPGIREKILKALGESIDASIARDGGHAWWWIQRNDGVKIGEFGCGPTSEANAEFWAHSRSDIPFLLSALNLALGALEHYNSEAMDAGSTISSRHADHALEDIEALAKEKP